MGKCSYDEDMILHAVGDRLRELRQEYGYTFKEMAKEACIDRDNYMRVERGERNSSIGLFCNIASGLNIKVSDIFNEEYKEHLMKYDDIAFLRKILSSDEYKLIKKKKVINMLKKYRAKSGISQSILAAELGVSRNMINNLEYGRGRIKAELLIGMLNIFNLSVEELLAEIGINHD